VASFSHFVYSYKDFAAAQHFCQQNTCFFFEDLNKAILLWQHSRGILIGFNLKNQSNTSKSGNIVLRTNVFCY